MEGRLGSAGWKEKVEVEEARRELNHWRFLDPEPLARQTAHPRTTSMSPMSALRLSHLHDLATSKMVCGYRHAETRQFLMQRTTPIMTLQATSTVVRGIGSKKFTARFVNRHSGSHLASIDSMRLLSTPHERLKIILSGSALQSFFCNSDGSLSGSTPRQAFHGLPRWPDSGN